MEVQILAGDRILSLVLEGTATIAQVKALVAEQTKVKEEKQNIYFKGKVLENKQTLNECGVKSQEMLEMRSGVPSSVNASATPMHVDGKQQNANAVAASASAAKPKALTAHVPRPTLDSIPPQLFQNPAALQTYIRSEPALLEQLMRVNPTMAEAVLADGPQFLTQILNEQNQRRRDAENAQFRRINQLNADPLSVEAQASIAEEIRLKNVDANMEMAMEYNPEAFGRVVMLYVPMVVNQVPVVAFVDSGAQSTIMSVQCARRCNLDRLIDTRYAGVAVGVGTAKIVGRVHAAVLQVGSASLTASFTILDNQSMDFLFGLDMLKKFQACIDLKDNALKIAGQSIPFLPEKDIPKALRESEEVHSPTAHPKPPAAAAAAAASSSSSASARPSGSAAAAPSSSSAAARPSGAAALPPAGMSAAGAAALARAGAAAAPKPTAVAATAATPAAAPKPAAVAGAVAGAGAGGGAARPASSATPASAAASAANNNSGGFPEATITAVMNVGASRAQAISALKMFGGNAEAAAAYVFQTMGGGGFGF